MSLLLALQGAPAATIVDEDGPGIFGRVLIVAALAIGTAPAYADDFAPPAAATFVDQETRASTLQVPASGAAPLAVTADELAIITVDDGAWLPPSPTLGAPWSSRPSDTGELAIAAVVTLVDESVAWASVVSVALAFTSPVDSAEHPIAVVATLEESSSSPGLATSALAWCASIADVAELPITTASIVDEAAWSTTRVPSLVASSVPRIDEESVTPAAVGELDVWLPVLVVTSPIAVPQRSDDESVTVGAIGDLEVRAPSAIVITAITLATATSDDALAPTWLSDEQDRALCRVSSWSIAVRWAFEIGDDVTGGVEPGITDSLPTGTRLLRGEAVITSTSVTLVVRADGSVSPIADPPVVMVAATSTDVTVSLPPADARLAEDESTVTAIGSTLLVLANEATAVIAELPTVSVRLDAGDVTITEVPNG